MQEFMGENIGKIPSISPGFNKSFRFPERRNMVKTSGFFGVQPLNDEREFR